MSRTMSDTQGVGYRDVSGWVGWIAFAAVFMMVGGVMNAISGLVALVNDEWVVWAHTDSLYVDLTTWGWAHLIIGLVVALSGAALLTGSVVARTVGVIAASLSLLANWLWLPAYPFWAITVMVIDALIIWALIVHGGELRKV
ncbi:MAG: hypothetical protein S0880_06470 [Actinomycetota bacterium]|nr:hypothetical protein [Actinomycetota bacterium]